MFPTHKYIQLTQITVCTIYRKYSSRYPFIQELRGADFVTRINSIKEVGDCVLRLASLVSYSYPCHEEICIFRNSDSKLHLLENINLSCNPRGITSMTQTSVLAQQRCTCVRNFPKREWRNKRNIYRFVRLRFRFSLSL